MHHRNFLWSSHLSFSKEKGVYALRPDIIIDHGRIIDDTKWKLLSQEKARQGISGSDLYQMYAYGKKYANCTELCLIYPKDEEMNTVDYDYYKEAERSLPLRILFFDLEETYLEIC